MRLSRPVRWNESIVARVIAVPAKTMTSTTGTENSKAMLLIGCMSFYKRARATAGDAAPVLMCIATRQPNPALLPGQNATARSGTGGRERRSGAPVDHTEECRTALCLLVEC